MCKLLKLNFINLFANKLFYVCLLLLLSSPIFNYIGSLNADNLENYKVFTQIMNFLSSEISLISIIFISLFACFDYTEGTMKNIIARGFTRSQVLFSKYVVSIVGLFIMYLITILLTFVLFRQNGIGYEQSMLLPLINRSITIIAHIFLFVTLASLFEKNSSSIIACLFVPTIIVTCLNLIDSNLKMDISKFWLDNISNDFNSNPSISNFYNTIGVYLIYIIIFIIFGNKMIKKKEIK